MRILYLNHNLTGRGTYFRCLQLAQQAVQAGHAATLLCAADARCIRPRVREEHGVRILEEPRLGPQLTRDGGYGLLDLFWRLAHGLVRRYDLIHAFDHRPNVLLPSHIIAAGQRLPVIADWADWWTRGGITTPRRPPWQDALEARLEEGQKRRADAVTVTSSLLYERAQALGIDKSRLVLAPSGADVDRLTPRDPAACRAQLALPGDIPIAVLVGYSLWDLAHLLQAWAVVRQQLPTAHLLIAGGIAADELQQLAKQHNVAGAVTGLGPVPYAELNTVLGAADVGVLPLQDTLANRARGPMKFGDYLAAGRAVVTQDVGDCAALVRRHELGEVATPDAASLGTTLASLLHNRERCATIGRHARRFAEEHYRWSQLAQPVLHLYERLIAQRSTQP